MYFDTELQYFEYSGYFPAETPSCSIELPKNKKIRSSGPVNDQEKKLLATLPAPKVTKYSANQKPCSPK